MASRDWVVVENTGAVRILTMNRPEVIGAINGPVLTGGLETALGCDFRDRFSRRPRRAGRPGNRGRGA